MYTGLVAFVIYTLEKKKTSLQIAMEADRNM